MNIPGNSYPMAFETLAPAATALSITSTVRVVNDVKARGAIIGPVETTNCRFRLDGTAPTTTVGHLLSIGDVLTLEGSLLVENFKIISTAAAAGVPVTTLY